jgi:hypothetical protein
MQASIRSKLQVQVNKIFVDIGAVLGIRIRMFFGLPDPDPLVTGTDVEQTESVLA